VFADSLISLIIFLSSPSCEYPPIGVGDGHPARLSLFPRIQMIPFGDLSASAASTSMSINQPCPPPPWVTASPELYQPSPRRARLEKMRAIRPERGIRICRKETSSVVSAASSGGVSDSCPSSPEQTRNCVDLTSPPPSSALSMATITGTVQSEYLPASCPASESIPTACMHPRFRRYQATEPRIMKSARDQYASDSSECANRFRTYTPDQISSPEQTVPTLSAARWSTLGGPSSSPERFPSPLSDLSSSPPRTPSPPSSMTPLYPPGSEYDSGEDELGADVDDDNEYLAPCASSPAQNDHRGPTSRTAAPLTAVPPPAGGISGWAECRWAGCGKRFQRNFAPMRRPYAPFNQLHYEVLDHFRKAHDLDFLSLKKEPCQWEGCFKAMTGKSFHRHLLDAHMHLDAHRCEGCGVSFSRRDAVTRHKRRCEGKALRRTALPGTARTRVDKNGSPWEQPLPGETDAAIKFAAQIAPYTPRATPRPRFGEPKPRALSEEPLAQVVKREYPNRPFSEAFH
jgi:hypothetical protein